MSLSIHISCWYNWHAFISHYIVPFLDPKGKRLYLRYCITYYTTPWSMQEIRVRCTLFRSLDHRHMVSLRYFDTLNHGQMARLRYYDTFRPRADGKVEKHLIYGLTKLSCIILKLSWLSLVIMVVVSYLYVYYLSTNFVDACDRILHYNILIQFCLPSRWNLLSIFWCTYPYFISSQKIKHTDPYRVVYSF